MEKLEVVGFENVFSLTAVRLIFTSTIKNSFNMNCHCVVLFFKPILYLFTLQKAPFKSFSLVYKIETLSVSYRF